MNTSKSDLRMSGDYQRKVSDFVNREVLTNVNELMQALLKSEDFNQGEYSEELINICSVDDYEEPALYVIENAHNNDLQSYYDFYLNYFDLPITRKSELIEWINKNNMYSDFCNEFNIEPYQRESLKFWVVSEYFGRQLVENGENVQEILGLTIWGRTCSGQSILMDGVVCDIYDSLNS